MAIYLPDTNHASKLLLPGHPLNNRVDAAVQAGDSFLLPFDVVEEMQFGIEGMRDPVARAQMQAALDQLLTSFTTIPLTLDAALESGRIRGRLRRAGRQMNAVDGHLAAIARLSGYVLLTDDTDFAPLSGEVSLDNWLR